LFNGRLPKDPRSILPRRERSEGGFLKGSIHTVSMRAYNVSSGENQTIYAKFPLQTAKHMTKEKGLLDSGATHNFINIWTIIRLGIGTKRLKNPRTVTNVDGTTNRAGQINRYTNLQFDYKGKTRDLPVFITNLGRDRIILGLF
jgi:hypothetical protein